MSQPEFHIFRSHTVEPLFASCPTATFSGYGEVAMPVETPRIMVWFHTVGVDSSRERLLAEIAEMGAKLDLVLSQTEGAMPFWLVTLFPGAGPITADSDVEFVRAVAAYNAHLYDVAEARPAVRVLDLGDFLGGIARSEIVGWKYFYMAQMSINPALASEFADWFEGCRRSIESIRKKCLVLDLDNTLWGGVLGEEGIERIALGHDYPGNVFRDFQADLLEAARQGVILAICSKNNEEDVLEAFEKHPDMILSMEDIAAHRINWDDKASNIQQLADELNIGLDSMVFIDDNPRERELVKSFLPDVVVPEFPERPHQLRVFFQEVYRDNFRLYRLTDEDRKKTQQYKDNAARTSSGRSFADFDQYLRSLEIQVEIQVASTFNLPRIAQMTQKTNQFNLTTRRYTEGDLEAMRDDGALIICASVGDRFGDSGITGLLIFKDLSEGMATVDSYLLSCRILGRGIENAVFKHALNSLIDRGVECVRAEYLPTAKNAQVENFYDRIGFELEREEDGAKHYRMKLADRFTIEDYYRIEVADG